MKPFDDCWDCGFWSEDVDCCEFSLTADRCHVLDVEIHNFYEEEIEEGQ